MPEVVKAHVHRLLLGEILRTLEGKSPASRNKGFDVFIISLFGLD